MDLSPILSLFSADPRILALYALGSAVNGNMRPDSDIDLAVLVMPGTRLGALERAELAADASIILGRDVDLGELSSSNLVYAYEVIMKGRRLFERDEGRAGLMEACLLGMFANFNLERRELLDAYRIG